MKNLNLRRTISGLIVLVAVLSSIALAVGIYVSLSADVERQGRDKALASLRTAAAIFASATSGYEVSWRDDGTIGDLSVWGLLPYHDHELVDRISRVTGSQTAIYVEDRKTHELSISTTTFMDEGGERSTGTVLEEEGPIYQTLTDERSYVGQQTVNGESHFVAYHPIVHENRLVGAIFVAETTQSIAAGLVGTMTVVLMVAGMVTVVLGIAGYFMSRLVTGPIPRLVKTMARIANGDFETKVPYLDYRNELGEMARAVEVFRENGLKVRELTGEEKRAAEQRRVERIDMMQSLQRAFGEVVDAAVAGDFSKQVEADFPDAELNALADSVNELVETVARGLGETGEVLSAIADTDLTRRVEGDFKGAFAKLKDDTNAVADKLYDVVSQLRETSQGVKTATSEILTGANDLNKRTVRQAATIEETSAAMELLASTLVENAKHAQNAAERAQDVSAAAEEGTDVMVRATQAMEGITQSASKISTIIGMIDEIAFQTNLLALNASVEAARVGEAGKGFAVVAVEVRQLAQSAANASSEVKKLIRQSSSAVNEGSELVAEVATKLETMLQSAHASNSLMNTIAEASRKQVSCIEEINADVRQMDEITQHNAALVEETNATIEQTRARAFDLDNIVAIFKIDMMASTAIDPEESAMAGEGVMSLKRKVTDAARSYFSPGSAAIDQDWV
ncbi:methyl-accepting chemotaxis protein [Notoacmeibacter sp. MSK16QG-6]|uniref:methyl-accepting chemotaxis protein n=1 Tax=Notoacmeibacter sp. MSK16QG-6 TaxID=2957982 RepID=UPI0020A0C44B|nr:methyl-accepting chemotaxis protein [Notoacmeibacter sp. MSK16QG-6]MCP1200621.1 methyl-accepting chemotaxis protein [Notoacmeibacter sp. MSK16QG-6]